MIGERPIGHGGALRMHHGCSKWDKASYNAQGSTSSEQMKLASVHTVVPGDVSVPCARTRISKDNYSPPPPPPSHPQPGSHATFYSCFRTSLFECTFQAVMCLLSAATLLLFLFAVGHAIRRAGAPASGARRAPFTHVLRFTWKQSWASSLGAAALQTGVKSWKLTCRPAD